MLVAGEGETYDEAVVDHDIKLKRLFQRCAETGIRLNKDKLRLRVQNVQYMGRVLTSEGVKSEETKVKAILDMERPKDVAAISRFVGMVNYLGNLSDLCEPLRQLTRRHNEFCGQMLRKKHSRKLRKL